MHLCHIMQVGPHEQAAGKQGIECANSAEKPQINKHILQTHTEKLLLRLCQAPKR